MMTNKKAVIWLINLTADIGKAEHRSLWHYEQALCEIKEMLENTKPERKKGKWVPYDGNKKTGNTTTCLYFSPKCSECGKAGDYAFEFCPNCGSDMRGEEDEYETDSKGI